ncbi:Phosphate regulon transcriptional regulatory protein PhoB (SphR) [Candidatus Syntrophocurvum alkaliphilum]|uniref:Stage 0 sporulation protein A homolog n=1 Tax=Candidatus Syntrophocurvum alkaliphilum TaxID=2293317 RepID=A0A6I6DEE2_9FIRM|nr:Phosphate regulon transcriptional regulatory protein PhoB (SphR) [Candidatus Syntrophocurvum alkaliphilum]
MSKILVVDDEKTLVKGIVYNLEQEGYEAFGVYDGEQALKEAKTGKYDLMVLDLMLPIIDGFTICRKIREYSKMPIIMLTARGDDLDKIAGLEMGADDYMVKPFNIRELIARINSVLRRSVTPTENFKNGNLIVDIAKRTVYKGNTEIELTSKEFDLLSVLIKNSGRVFSRSQLIDLVWNMEYADERTVDVNIRRLREKLEDDPRQPVFILTKWGVGYYMRELM